MPHHKMQSSEGLELKLDQVPKMLAKLTSEWAPKSYVVSFKLETDEAILIKKAENSIISYNVNLVIANLLHTRRDSCLIVERNSDSATLGNNGTTKHDNSFSITEIVSHPSMMQVEVSLVQEVSSRHFTHFKASGGITDSTSWMPTDQVTPSVRKLRKHIFAKYDRTLEDAYNTVQDEVRSAIDLTKPILISLVVGIAAFYLGRATAR